MMMRPNRRRRADHGLTLPEVLIVVSLMGLITAVIASAMIVTLRQAGETEGRTNVSRAETAVDTWLPADLASTDVNNTDLPAVELDPAAEPCTTTCNGIDLSGANALQLAWQSTVGQPPVEIVTKVQYQYIQVGESWQLRRIQCVGAAPCTVITLLFDVEAPEDPDAYNADTDRPVWVLDVAVPDDPADLDLGDNARKIVVTIDGGGTGAGAAGGINSISLTAGGRTTEEIDADDFTVPSFVRAKSRCGGPITLIVDISGSIGDTNAQTVVQPGVNAFIEAFRGTPTQIQVVKFDREASTIGPSNERTTENSGWHRYIDMTNDDDIDALKSVVLTEIDPDGGNTNWEDAFFRTFKESDGTNAAAQPNRIVFFTDGIPTVSRPTGFGQWWDDYSEGDKFIDYNAGHYDREQWPNEDGNSFHQESWDRADVILDDHRNVDMVFVAVGPSLNDSIDWIHKPQVYDNPNVAPSAAVARPAYETIAHLLANAASGHVTATFTGTGADIEYTNPETADFYLLNEFDADAFAAAMRAAALKDCGGTLTIQTRDTASGAPIDDEFKFENPSYRDDEGNEIEATPRAVTTSENFRTGTFDFDISDSTDFFSVDVVPVELQTLDGYQFDSWSCRSGASAKTITATIEINESDFEGFTVPVLANEAVSCTMNVSPA